MYLDEDALGEQLAVLHGDVAVHLVEVDGGQVSFEGRPALRVLDGPIRWQLIQSLSLIQTYFDSRSLIALMENVNYKIFSLTSRRGLCRLRRRPAREVRGRPPSS